MAGPDAIDFLFSVQAFAGRGVRIFLKGFDSLDKLALDFLTLRLDKLLRLGFELNGIHPCPGSNSKFLLECLQTDATRLF